MYLSTGNAKMKPNANTKFLIWNLPAQNTCPHATELCKKYCYAKKAERLYPQVLKCREDNLQDSLQDDFVQNMVNAIEEYRNRKSWKDKTILFRIHESGDFYNAEYTKKWLEVAGRFPDIKFLAFTKSLPFFEGLEIPHNFILRASIWSDTLNSHLKDIQSNEYCTYTAIQKTADKPLQAIECPCKRGCADCQLCWTSKAKNIYTTIH